MGHRDELEQAILHMELRRADSVYIEGDADFVGNLGSVSTPCSNPLFLLRLSANNRWIAAGAVRVIGNEAN